MLRNQRGMTLIEIMIVIAIIGGLMVALGNVAINQRNKARYENAKIHLKTVQKALELYNGDCMSYPKTDVGLKALTANPGADACPNWGPQPYIKEKELRDPWNHELSYESDGATMSLRSYGADGKDGGDGYNKDVILDEL